MKIHYLTLASDPDISLRVASFTCGKEGNHDRTIVIIPGFFGSIEERTTLAEGLAENYNVIVYEPRGYGESSKKRQKGMYTVDSYAREMREVLRMLHLRDHGFVLFGSSLAIATLHQYSAYIDGEKPEPAAMIFVSPAPRYKQAGILRFLGWIPGWMITFVRKAVFLFLWLTRNREERKNLTYAQNRFVALDPWVQFRIAVESVARIDFNGGERDIPVPLCVFIAEKDDFTDPEHSRKYIHHPDSEMILVKADAHKFIQGKEDILVAHINRFLSTRIWPS
ncbi:MAG: alpha/beta fold hydrolase [Spirochaetes bacterium]|nr:alpha/beta fold hydrolase [Spirochaetota bacterium]